MQEDLPQEQADNAIDPDGKKQALSRIIARYNQQFGTNHRIEEFDQYYQDVQKRIKDHQFPNHDLPRKGAEKVDLTIVVDMLLTGFDSKYLNTLYVDKNLKHHGLIQAFSRTNRVLNASKPYGHILDFRGQQDAVDEAIKLFSGVSGGVENARKIWLVGQPPSSSKARSKPVTSSVAGRAETRNSRATPPRPRSSNSSRPCRNSRPSLINTPT